ncbi:2-dehydropantoate 2-reductase (plasmid) [Gemmatirosa kalamazoonensis]|uniref:2-dehydropantoate 2-reductase n=1 Tax=Gemmatirosa kalamazoonensis TaxID=861299 RepID=W0RPB7_9BACT|nr:2-dehydropantoate 2-reductase [Gemmatirosa kalamazoonensis]AHG92332.1 2-dehydropantoate 2-reductase [Gemmatirosa kalamazoonensis]
MRFAVVGVGGIGGYFGGRLALAGEDVAFVARGAHLAALRERGLAVESVRGDFALPSVMATDDPVAVGPVDVVLVGVKTWQLGDVAATMGPMLGPETVVIPFQNGVEAADVLGATVGRQRVLLGTARIFSFIDGPGRIRHLGGPASLAFGETDGGSSPRVERIRAAMERAGITVERPADMRVELWEKFLFVVSLGGVGAVARVPVGVLRAVPETRALLRRAMTEIGEVARASGVTLPGDAIDRAMTFVDAQPAGATTSLQRDLADGRPSELEAWNGAVVRLGARAGVATPLHEFLYHALLPTELRSRGELGTG